MTVGVFVYQNAEKIARNTFVNTRQEDMPEARKRIISQLYTGAIDPDRNIRSLYIRRLTRPY